MIVVYITVGLLIVVGALVCFGTYYSRKHNIYQEDDELHN